MNPTLHAMPKEPDWSKLAEPIGVLTLALWRAGISVEQDPCSGGFCKTDPYPMVRTPPRELDVSKNEYRNGIVPMPSDSALILLRSVHDALRLIGIGYQVSIDHDVLAGGEPDAERVSVRWKNFQVPQQTPEPIDPDAKPTDKPWVVSAQAQRLMQEYRAWVVQRQAATNAVG